MLRESVDEMLSKYREYLGRCGHLELEIGRYEKAVRMYEENIAEYESEHAQQYSDMPRGSELSNPTEKIGIKLADGFKPDGLKRLMDDLKQMQDEYQRKNVVVVFVRAWLGGLSEKERWIVEQQRIDGVCWREVRKRYGDVFGDVRSLESLKRIKRESLEKIYKMAA